MQQVPRPEPPDRLDPTGRPRPDGPARPRRAEADAWADSPQNMAVVLSMLLSIGACCGIFGLGPALVQARSGVVFVVGILVFILAGIFQALAIAVLVHAFRMAARSPAGYLHPAFAVPGLLFVSFLFIVGICIVLWGVGCALSAGPKPSDLCP